MIQALRELRLRHQSGAHRGRIKLDAAARAHIRMGDTQRGSRHRPSTTKLQLLFRKTLQASTATGTIGTKRAAAAGAPRLIGYDVPPSRGRGQHSTGVGLDVRQRGHGNNVVVAGIEVRSHGLTWR